MKRISKASLNWCGDPLSYIAGSKQEGK